MQATATDTEQHGLSAGNAQAGFDQPCPTCGAATRVAVLEGYLEGQPVRRFYCLACADHEVGPAPTDPAGQRHGIPFLFGVAGVIFALAGMFADLLGFSSQAGFGWYQGVGVAAGGLIIFLGAILRADIVALFGTLVFIGALCIDVFGVTRAPGVGVEQQWLLILAALCLAAPLFTRVLRSVVIEEEDDNEIITQTVVPH